VVLPYLSNVVLIVNGIINYFNKFRSLFQQIVKLARE